MRKLLFLLAFIPILAQGQKLYLYKKGSSIAYNSGKGPYMLHPSNVRVYANVTANTITINMGGDAGATVSPANFLKEDSTAWGNNAFNAVTNFTVAAAISSAVGEMSKALQDGQAMFAYNSTNQRWQTTQGLRVVNGSGVQAFDISPAGVATGNGSGLTNLPAGNLTGTVDVARLPASVARTDQGNTFTGTNTFGAISATSVGGNGSGLTNLNASNLTGNIDAARLPATTVYADNNQTITGQKNFSGSRVATGGSAQGTIFSPTLTATANNDQLTGVTINPAYINQSFSGILQVALSVVGNAVIAGITNTQGGLIVPVLTTTQQNSLTNPSAGMIIYNSQTSRFTGRTGTTWYQFAPVSGGSDIEIVDPTKGLILRSPNNTRYRLTVGDAGNAIFTVVP